MYEWRIFVNQYLKSTDTGSYLRLDYVWSPSDKQLMSVSRKRPNQRLIANICHCPLFIYLFQSESVVADLTTLSDASDTREKSLLCDPSIVFLLLVTMKRLKTSWSLLRTRVSFRASCWRRSPKLVSRRRQRNFFWITGSERRLRQICVDFPSPLPLCVYGFAASSPRWLKIHSIMSFTQMLNSLSGFGASRRSVRDDYDV